MINGTEGPGHLDTPLTVGALQQFIATHKLKDDVPLVIGGYDFDDRTEYAGLADYMSYDDYNPIGARLVVASVNPGLASFHEAPPDRMMASRGPHGQTVSAWLDRLVDDPDGPRIDGHVADEIVAERLACAHVYGVDPHDGFSNECLELVSSTLTALTGDIGRKIAATFGVSNPADWQGRRDCAVTTDLFGTVISCYASASQYRTRPTRSCAVDDIALNCIAELGLFLVESDSAAVSGLDREPGWVPIPKTYLRLTGFSCIEASRHLSRDDIAPVLRDGGIRMIAASIPLRPDWERRDEEVIDVWDDGGGDDAPPSSPPF